MPKYTKQELREYLGKIRNQMKPNSKEWFAIDFAMFTIDEFEEITTSVKCYEDYYGGKE